MKVLNNVSLKPYNTFGIEVFAKHWVETTSVDELIQALQIKEKRKIILSGGSNVLFTKDIDGLIIRIANKGKEIIKEDENFVFVKVEAGEVWHEFVLWCLTRNYGGIENLSLIPGLVGTTPVQNIGAYGAEIKDVLESCEVLDKKTFSIKTLSLDQCKLSYRGSIFKREAKGKYVITSVTFRLSKKNHKLSTSYGAITHELSRKGIKNPSIQSISQAVIKIRQDKLPNPKTIGNGGSFFKNPVISSDKFNILKNTFPNIPHYETPEGNKVKIPAGWLIDRAGLKGKRFGSCGIHEKQALVLVNYGKAKGSDILELSKIIQHTIKRLFDINLEPEVNII